MTTETKIISAIGAVAIILVIGAMFFSGQSNSSPLSTPGPSANTDLLIQSDSHRIGSDSAKVKIVEFGDYQCPACGAAYPIVKRILSDYDGQIEFVFRNFPLPQHQNAQISAEAAEAAGEQGKYWQMHDLLYEKQVDWSESTQALDIFVGYANQLGLNIDKFKSDISANKYANLISKDQADGNSVGINATPTFFINGSKIEGVPNYNNLKSEISGLLAK